MLDTAYVLSLCKYYYSLLYANDDNHDNYRIALALGNRIISSGGGFVRQLILERGDCFSSDREVAALGLALIDAASDTISPLLS